MEASSGGGGADLLIQLGQHIRDLENSVAQARQENKRLNDSLAGKEKRIESLQQNDVETSKKLEAKDQALSDLQKSNDQLDEQLKERARELNEVNAKLKEESQQKQRSTLEEKEQSTDNTKTEMDSKEDSGRDEERLVSPYQTQLRRRCVALGFQRLTHEGEPDYVDMFDGGRAENPNPFHEQDLAAWKNGKALGKMNASEVHVWELTRIADLPEQPGLAESQFDEEEETADAGTGGGDSIVKSPRDSVVGNMDFEKRDEPQKRAEMSSPGRDEMTALPFNRRDSVQDLGPVSGFSTNRTSGMQALVPKQSNLRDGRLHDPGCRHHSTLHHPGVENRGHKRRLPPEVEDANTQIPQCYCCCGLGQNCTGDVRCKVCTAAGVEVCTYRYCSNGLSCRDPRCDYVHPRQMQDDPRWTIQEGSLPEKGALVRTNRQIPICVHCWRHNHWCDSTKRCEPCQKDGTRCIYKARDKGKSCRMKFCNYMHPNQYDKQDPNWNVELGDIGITRNKLENGAPLPRPPGQTNEFAHRKAVCKHCLTTGALCDSHDKCGKCYKEGIECVRVLCEKGKDCKNLQCRAAHPGQFGCRAILEKKVVPFNPPKAPSRWFELYRR